MKLRVTSSRFSAFSRREWTHWLAAMVDNAEHMGLVPPTVGESGLRVELFLVRDGDIAALNRRHLDCPGPTNILSFPAGFGPGGDLFLSVDTLGRECRLYGQEAGEHARRLLAHGLAHVLGFDHGSAMDGVCACLLRPAQTVTLTAGAGYEKPAE